MDRVRTVATFVAGVLVGGSAVYFSPPGQRDAASGPPTLHQPELPPLPPGQGLPPDGAVVPPGQVPTGPDGQPISMGQPGQPGTVGQAVGPDGKPLPAPAVGPDGQPLPTAAPTATAPPVATGVVPVATSNLPPADAAEGPPPDDLATAPAGLPQTSGSRLEKHLRMAESVWTSQAATAKASGKEAIRKLAPDIEEHARSVPPIGEHMPPMQDVAGYLAASRVLLDRMSAAGMDVADLSLQIDMLMRPPRGKIPGGPKSP